MSKNIIIIVLFMALILILAIIPVHEVKSEMKQNLGFLSSIRSMLERTFDIAISWSKVQDFLHIPFFAALSFLWMRFYRKKKVGLVRAIGYTLIITVIFSILEESCQFFLARDASVKDLISNVIGSLIGIGASLCTVKKAVA